MSDRKMVTQKKADYPGFAEYDQATSCQIPVVIPTPEG